MKARVYIFVVLILFCITTGCDCCDPDPEVYTITFDITDGKGTIPEPKTYEEGEIVKLSSLPKEEGFSCTGHRLNGWSKVKDGDALTSDFSIESNMTLYAVWKQNDNSDEKIVDNKVNVHFNRNGGMGSDTTYVVEKGETIYYYDFPSSVFRADYTLLGWSVESNGQPIDYSITITCDTTLYAIWESNFVKVDFNLNDGWGRIDTTWVVERNDYIYSSKFPKPIWDNYTLKGWSASSDGDIISGGVQVTSDTTLYARWNRLYKVMFDKNGGVGTTPDVKEIEEGDYLYSYDLPNVSNLTRDGYTFRGWSQASEGEPISENLRITSNTTLYAVWSRNTHQVTFDINGGSGATPDSKEIEDGNYLYASDLPDGIGFSYTGYKFNGWSDSRQGEPISGSFKVTRDITLYAVWSRIKYTVSFDKNGGRGTTPDDIEIEDGNYLYVSDLPDDSYFTRSGYNFKGWSETQDGTPMTSRKRVTGNVTLYAVWQKVYTISFHRNGGSGSLPDDIEIEDGNYLYVSDLPDGSTLSRSGYDFEGWSTIGYGEPISRNFQITQNYTLYALWSRNVYRVSFDINGGSGSTPSYVDVNAGDCYYDLPDDSYFWKNNFTFRGWYDAQGTKKTIVSFVCPTEDMTLMAYWYPKEPDDPSIIPDPELPSIENPKGLDDPVASVSVDKAVDYIKNLPYGETHEVVVNGYLTQEKLKEISGAIQYANSKVYLDLSDCYGLSEIGEDAFANCYQLVKIIIPSCIKTIGKNAFRLCYRLTDVELPNSVESIGYQAFELCDKLVHLQIPNSVKVIDSWAFHECTNLDIIIPYSVKAIGYYALSSVGSITFSSQYNWYTTTLNEDDWLNKENGTSVDILSDDTYNSSYYYYKK